MRFVLRKLIVLSLGLSIGISLISMVIPSLVSGEQDKVFKSVGGRAIVSEKVDTIVWQAECWKLTKKSRDVCIKLTCKCDEGCSAITSNGQIISDKGNVALLCGDVVTFLNP